MKKKWLYSAISGIFALSILSACGNGEDTEQQEQPAEGPTVDENPAVEDEHPQLNNTETEENTETDEGTDQEMNENEQSNPEENSESGTGGGIEEGSIHGQDSEGEISPESEETNKEENQE